MGRLVLMKTTTTLLVLVVLSEADLRFREMREEQHRQIMEAFCLPADVLQGFGAQDQVRGESAGVREVGGSSPPRPT